MWEEKPKKKEERRSSTVGKITERKNGIVIDADTGECDVNKTEQLIFLNLSNSNNSETAEEYVTRNQR